MARDTHTPAKTLKVLHVGKYYPPNYGGIESHTQTLAQGLAQQVDVHVVVSNPRGPENLEERDGKVQVTRLGTPKTIAKAPISPGLFKAVAQSDSDIVHLHWPNPIGLLAALCDPRRRPLMLTYHSDVVKQKWLAKLFWPFLWLALQRAQRIIVTSWRYVETSPILRRYAEKCVSIPLGADYGGAPDAERIAAVRAEHAHHDEPLYLAIGRLVYYKGFDVLIRALAQLPTGRLVLIGRGPDYDALVALSESLGVRARIDFLSRVEDLRPYYAAADQFILPSTHRSEAFGIVQIEAMQQGCPVINTALDTAVPEVSAHAETGLTVPPGDPMALAAAMAYLTAHPDEARALGAAGQLRADRLFTARAMANATLRCYDQVLRACALVPPVTPGELHS